MKTNIQTRIEWTDIATVARYFSSIGIEAKTLSQLARHCIEMVAQSSGDTGFSNDQDAQAYLMVAGLIPSSPTELPKITLHMPQPSVNIPMESMESMNFDLSHVPTNLRKGE